MIEKNLDVTLVGIVGSGDRSEHPEFAAGHVKFSVSAHKAIERRKIDVREQTCN